MSTIKNSKNKYQDIEDFFAEEFTPNQKAWSITIDFYDQILSEMKKKGIKRTDVAEKMGVSPAAVSKLLNNTPNITLKKMVELADSVGLDLQLTTVQTEAGNKVQTNIYQLKSEIKSSESISVTTGKVIPFDAISKGYLISEIKDKTVSDKFANYGG